MKLRNGQFCMGIKEVRAVFFFLDVRFLTCLMHILWKSGCNHLIYFLFKKQFEKNNATSNGMF